MPATLSALRSAPSSLGSFAPKVVVLYTGAAEPRGRFHMTMGSEDALEAAHAFPDSTLIAVHNGDGPSTREPRPIRRCLRQVQSGASFDPHRKGRPVSAAAVSPRPAPRQSFVGSLASTEQQDIPISTLSLTCLGHTCRVYPSFEPRVDSFVVWLILRRSFANPRSLAICR